MPERLRRFAGWGVAIAAIAVMVVGLLPKTAEADPEVRQQQLSQRIACPWCHGQSLAESENAVAQDLVVILREKIDAGWSDDQIYSFFADRYGDQVVLDPPWTGWGIALWSLPALALLVGGGVIWTRQRGPT
jgi:cytochrome c-type biogenesis protein CcmH